MVCAAATRCRLCRWLALHLSIQSCRIWVRFRSRPNPCSYAFRRRRRRFCGLYGFCIRIACRWISCTIYNFAFFRCVLHAAGADVCTIWFVVHHGAPTRAPGATAGWVAMFIAGAAVIVAARVWVGVDGGSRACRRMVLRALLLLAGVFNLQF